MIELFFNKNRFDILFCKYRLQNHFEHASDFLMKHKLLLMFIIFSIIPNIQNLHLIGMPFFIIVSPESAISIKLLSLSFILVSSMLFINVQAVFIKGGALRKQIQIYPVSIDSHKKIDLIILSSALNFIWIAILFGFLYVLHLHEKSTLFSSLILYVSFIPVFLIFLLSSLYKNIFYTLSLLLNSVLICMASLVSMVGLSLSLGFFSLMFAKYVYQKIYLNDVKHTAYSRLIGSTLCWKTFEKIAPIQNAAFQENKALFYKKYSYALFLCFFLLYLFSLKEISLDHSLWIVFIGNIEIYILSALFSVFQVQENKYNLFHKVFPFEASKKYLKEVLIVSFLLFVANLPLIIYIIMNNKFWMIIGLFLLSIFPIAVNRALYFLSMRYSLLTTLLNTILWITFYFITLGDSFGN